MTENRRRDDPRITALVGATETAVANAASAAATAAESARLAALLATRIEHTHSCVEELKRMAKENKETLDDMKAILSSFRVVGALAKWIASVVAAGSAIVLFWRNLKGGG